MKIIVMGCGKLGYEITEQLYKEGHNISVIDINPEAILSVTSNYDVMGVVANGANFNKLIDIGIEKANLFIAVTESDELNLLCCLFAKKASKCHTIARVRNPVYSHENKFIKNELGLSMIINPEHATAMEIVKLLRFPSAIKIDTFAKGKIRLYKFKIKPSSCICNMKIIDIRNKLDSGVLFCAVQRKTEVFIPTGDFILHEMDIAYIIAPPNKSSEFFKKIRIHTNQVKNTILVGGGKITYYLAQQLINIGINVKIIEKDKVKCEELSAEIPKATIINADAINKDMLLEEGLETAESFVTLTNFDEENILLGLYAKSKSNAKLVVKINKLDFDDVIENLDIGSVICPKYIISDYIIQYARAIRNSIGSNVEKLYKIIENKAEALEFYVKETSPIIGIPLEKLNIKKNILICSINKKGKFIVPNGQDIIRAGNTVIIVTTNTGLNDICDILEKR
ncbi:MAG: Trk system potassium transporter TrkA [Clostridiales bacterium]